MDYNSKNALEENAGNKYSKSFDIVQDTTDTLMHNKFFIFDSNSVFAGSMNLTSTGSGGYNSNIALIFRDKDIAKIYENELNNKTKAREYYEKMKILNDDRITFEAERNIERLKK